MITSHLIAHEGRQWLLDCGFRGATSLSDRGVLVFVNRNYSGGLPAFIRADPDWPVAECEAALIRTFGEENALKLLTPHPAPSLEV